MRRSDIVKTDSLCGAGFDIDHILNLDIIEIDLPIASDRARLFRFLPIEIDLFNFDVHTYCLSTERSIESGIPDCSID